MATEVFNNIGEEEMHSENPKFYRRGREEDYDESDELKSSEKIESTSKAITEAKKEFHEYIENDYLTVDTCERLNHDWKSNRE